jgi:hypothetical protein
VVLVYLLNYHFLSVGSLGLHLLLQVFKPGFFVGLVVLHGQSGSLFVLQLRLSLLFRLLLPKFLSLLGLSPVLALEAFALEFLVIKNLLGFFFASSFTKGLFKSRSQLLGRRLGGLGSRQFGFRSSQGLLEVLEFESLLGIQLVQENLLSGFLKGSEH